MKYQDDDFNEMILYLTTLRDENISLKIEQEELHKKPKLKTDLTVWGITDASKVVGCARNTFLDILKNRKKFKKGVDYLTDGKNYYLFSRSSLLELKKVRYEKITREDK